jgi:hypothetical protein
LTAIRDESKSSSLGFDVPTERSTTVTVEMSSQYRYRLSDFRAQFAAQGSSSGVSAPALASPRTERHAGRLVSLPPWL